ncbi:MAG: hypothetical protein MPL62_13635 [Alphaproteobacteria bacterium]|nr:hypothetical protein [Alphaproteobacteria bacterium]
MTTNETLSRSDLLTDCERSMRYHHARERFFDGAHSFIQFLLFASSSTGGGVLLLGEFSAESVSAVALGAVSLLALLSLVWNPSNKGKLHRSLYRKFTRLLGEVYANENPDNAARAEWTRTIHELYAQEPPVFRALHAHCDNQIVIALDADRGHFVDLKFHQRLLRNFLPFQGGEFLSRNQLKEQAQQ